MAYKDNITHGHVNVILNILFEKHYYAQSCLMKITKDLDKYKEEVVVIKCKSLFSYFKKLIDLCFCSFIKQHGKLETAVRLTPSCSKLIKKKK